MHLRKPPDLNLDALLERLCQARLCGRPAQPQLVAVGPVAYQP